jgi:NAD(P)H-dependent FMN reductase
MKIQIIIGSTRQGRVGAHVADWVNENLPKSPGTDYEIVDLATWNLPFFDAAILPSMEQYENEHTKAWSQKIKEGDGYIFITPEYNAGYSAAIKNAIDYLYREWTDKPAMIISYGIGGGGGASAQLRQVIERLKMRPTEVSPAFVVNRDVTDENGQIKDINTAFQQYKSTLETAAEELLNAAPAVISSGA